MRHAAITLHLLDQARTAGGPPSRRQPPSAPVDAQPDPTPAPTRRLVRFAAAAQRLVRLPRRARSHAPARADARARAHADAHARARTPGLRAGSPGGGA